MLNQFIKFLFTFFSYLSHSVEGKNVNSSYVISIFVLFILFANIFKCSTNLKSFCSQFFIIFHYSCWFSLGKNQADRICCISIFLIYSISFHNNFFYINMTSFIFNYFTIHHMLFSLASEFHI